MQGKTYPDDGTCLRRALFSFRRRHQKSTCPVRNDNLKIFVFLTGWTDYKKFCFTLKARRKRVPEEGYHNYATITPKRWFCRLWAQERKPPKRLKPEHRDCLQQASGQASKAVSRSPSWGERWIHQQRSPWRLWQKMSRAVHQDNNSDWKTEKRNGFKDL